jgi:hypothetical protein
MSTPPTIHKGDTGSDVRLCQERLVVYGYSVTVDGVFGSNTETKVKEFQKAKGLTADGIVGTNTWNALLADPVEKPMPEYDQLTDLDRRMLCEIAQYVGWDYAKGTPSLVAQPSRLVPSNVVWAPGKKTDTVCCVFIGGIAGRVYDKTAKWSQNAWAHFMVPADDPWGMVEESLTAGIGKAYTGTPQDGRWYIVQKWTNLVDGKVVEGVSHGHQWFQWGPNWIIEANSCSDEDANGSSTDEGAVAWRHHAWNQDPKNVRVVELFTP